MVQQQFIKSRLTGSNLQVTCYSEAHVEDCREKVNKLEKEFKAFVRKIKQLTNCPGEAIPWTSRPYKRKNSGQFKFIKYQNSTEYFKLLLKFLFSFIKIFCRFILYLSLNNILYFVFSTNNLNTIARA